MSIPLALTNGFHELNARERAEALLDEGTFREILDPFERLESPHLAAQGIVPQSDDGVIIAKGMLDGESAVVISIEGAFQGGGVGEVSGAKMAGALELALRDCRNRKTIRPILLLETGGVRLQEGNYGLLAIAEIGAAIVALREFVPVVAVIPGMIGCFGGMSICAGLCSAVIMTKQGRLLLNGPEVIEQEAGIAELDSGDRRMVWRMAGGEQRHAVGFADDLADNSAEAIRKAITDAYKRGFPPKQRCSDVEQYLGKLACIDPSKRLDNLSLRLLWKNSGRENGITTWERETARHDTSGWSQSRGRTWFEGLSGPAQSASSGAASVLYTDALIGAERVRYIAVVPNPDSRYPRARSGEVGLEEGWTVARLVRDVVRQDEHGEKRAIIAIVDVPSQAYGYMEELLGLNLACAAAVDAYASARLAGHPVVALLVGSAISGAFLAHGLQSNRLLALDDPGVTVQAMSKKSAARVTRRTLAELEAAAEKIPAAAYDIRSFATLGALEELIAGVNADQPNDEELDAVRQKVASAIAKARFGGKDLDVRLASEEARTGRAASITVRERMSALWI